jgi:excisionase family DNA binding protein
MSEKLTIGLKEAAQTLGLSIWTLKRYVSDGRLACVRIGRRVLVEPGELARLVAEGRRRRQ